MVTGPPTKSGVAAGTVARLATGTAATLVGRFAGRGIQLLTQVFLARALGPIEFGVFTLAWALFRLASMFGLAGMDKAMTRFASAAEGAGRLARETRATVIRILAWGFSLASLVGIVLGLMAPVASGALHSPGIVAPLQSLAPAVPLAAVTVMVAAALYCRGRAIDAIWIQDLLQPSLALVLLPLALLSAAPVAWAARMMAVSFAVAGIVGLIRLFRWMGREGDPREEVAPSDASRERPASTRKILVYALHALSSASFVLLLYWLDKLMVGYFMDEYAVGLYQAAVQLNMSFVLIVASISAMLSPLVARLWTEGKRDQIEGVFRIGVRWCLYLATPVLVMILTLPAELMQAVFGSHYLAASSALVILGLGQFINAATGPVGQLFMMSGGERVWFVLSGASVPTSFVLNVVLIPRYGIEGAALGTGLTLVLLFGTATLVLTRRTGIRPYNRSLWRLGLAALLSSIVPLSLRLATDLGAWPVVILGGLSTLVVFGGTLWWFGIDSSELEAFRVLRARLDAGRRR